MAVPWLVLGNLVLSNLDKIIGVVQPGFTRKKVDVASAQFDLLNQQIAELQAAASSNAAQVSGLATQLKDIVAAIAQSATDAAAQRTAITKLAKVAIAVSVGATVLAVVALLAR